MLTVSLLLRELINVKLRNAVRRFFRAYPHAWWAFYFVFFILLFVVTEHVVDGSGPYWSSYVPLDDKIPFLEIFVIPYCLWYPYLAFVGLWLLFTDGANFRRYMQFIAVSFTLSLVFCLLVPNGQDLRPAVFPRDNLLTRTVAGLYAADTNTNVFPSMHVLGCMAGLFAAFHSAAMRRVRLPLLITALLIIASTVFIKQHSILDIYGGLALCLPLYLLIFRLPRRKES